MPPKPPLQWIWKETYRIQAHEVNPRDELYLFALTNYLQDAAANHARHLGFSIYDLEGGTYSWVMLRLYLTVERYPGWQESLTVETWPAGLERRFAYRDFLIKVGQEEIGRATTMWMMIHLETRRPCPLPDNLQQVHLPQRPRILTLPRQRIRPPETPATEARLIPALRTDEDLNHHINSSRYVAWTQESVPEAVYLRHQPRAFFIEFRTEARAGMEVWSRTFTEAPDTFLHTLTLKDSDQTLAVARSQFPATSG